MTAQNPYQVALLVARRLEGLGIPYVIAGSIASTIHGEPRATLDVDVVILLRSSQTSDLCTTFERDFFVDRQGLREAVRTTMIHRDQHVKVDLYPRPDSGINAEERRRAHRVRLTEGADSEVSVQSPEDTVLQKLVWYRKAGEVSDRQWRDVQGVLKARLRTLDHDYLRTWAAELGVADLLQRARRDAGLDPE